MPNRIIREAILSSEKVASLGWAEEVFYRRLMSIVDDFGRVEANPQLLRARCYPLQTDSVRVTDITRWMAACHDAGLILNYAVSGKQYLELANFGQQTRTPSKCPAPPPLDNTCQQMLANAHLGVSVSEGDVPKANALGVAAATPSGPPACPHEAVIALYHEALPECPRVVEWNDTRQGYLRARWREKSKPNGVTHGYVTTDAGLAWWRKFFGYCSQSKFLKGQRDGRNGGPPFVADLEWILRPTNFAKIIEGKYHREA